MMQFYFKNKNKKQKTKTKKQTTKQKLIGSQITPLFYYCPKQTFYPLQWIQ